MKKSSFLAFLLLFPLAGCDYAGGMREYNIPHNLSLKASPAPEYRDYAYGIGAQNIIEALERGEDVLFLLSSTECVYCDRFAPTFLNFIIQEGLTFYLVENNENLTQYQEELRRLNDYFIEGEELNGATPELFLAKGQEVHSIVAGNVSAYYLENSFDAEASAASYYLGKSYDDLIEADFEDPLYYLSPSNDTYFDEKLLPLFETRQAKPLLVFDYGKMTIEDQERTLAFFEIEEEEATLKYKEKEAPIATEGAQELLEEYLA